MLRICSLLVLLAAAVLPAGAADQPRITGPARVIDGDTLDVAGTRIRLYGVDAPERKQTCRTEQGIDWPCGQWSSEQVTALYEGVILACEPLDIDVYGRTVARCFDKGEDIAVRLVSEGILQAYPRYSTDYVAVEAAAKAVDAGLWAGAMTVPEVYRHRVSATPVQEAPDGCAIKGNISKGGRIYHRPGDRDYDKTRINPARGERWFCSAAEAEAEGWRAARR